MISHGLFWAQLGQSGATLRRVEALCEAFAEQALVVFTGDFNSTPNRRAPSHTVQSVTEIRLYMFVLESHGGKFLYISVDEVDGDGGWHRAVRSTRLCNI